MLVIPGDWNLCYWTYWESKYPIGLTCLQIVFKRSRLVGYVLSHFNRAQPLTFEFLNIHSITSVQYVCVRSYMCVKSACVCPLKLCMNAYPLIRATRSTYFYSYWLGTTVMYDVNSVARCFPFSNRSLFWAFVSFCLAQLVEALRYKSEGRGFESRLCHWNFPLT
jgi:hypothetical protein